jgi:hypothetical protein
MTPCLSYFPPFATARLGILSQLANAMQAVSAIHQSHIAKSKNSLAFLTVCSTLYKQAAIHRRSPELREQYQRITLIAVCLIQQEYAAYEL